MAMGSTALVTAEDLARLARDDRRYDLIRGRLVEMSPAGGEHGEIAAELARRLGNYVAEHRLGRVYGAETGFLLARDPDVVLGPDAAFVREDRLPPRSERRGFPSLAPDLAVEIVSPGDRMRDVREKVQTYLQHGVRLVWVVEPHRRQVTVHQADVPPRVVAADEQLDGADVLPAFALRVADLFL